SNRYRAKENAASGDGFPFATATWSKKIRSGLENSISSEETPESRCWGMLDGNSRDASDIPGRELITAGVRANQVRNPLTPARMRTRNRADARIESNAVTGPCTAEYGPSVPGKKKMASTHNTASAHATRPGVIKMF